MSEPTRGEVWWAGLPPLRGSETGYMRPIVVVQANRLNQSRIRTVIVVVITSNLDLAAAPGNARLRSEDSGLSRRSVVNVSQIFTLDRKSLAQPVTTLPKRVMNQVAEGL